MAKPPKEQQIESRPDGWKRFEKAVDAAVKSGPKHRTTAQPMAQNRKPQAELRVGKYKKLPKSDRSGPKKKAAKPPSK